MQDHSHEEEKAEDGDLKPRNAFLESVGVMAIVFSVMFLFISVMAWVGSKVQDEPYCYFEVNTGYENTHYREDIYKRVFIDCPKD